MKNTFYLNQGKNEPSLYLTSEPPNVIRKAPYHNKQLTKIEIIGLILQEKLISLHWTLASCPTLYT